MLAHGMITGGLPKCSTLSIAPTAVHRTKLGSAAVRSGAGGRLLLPLPQCRWRRALASATTKVDASSVSETELPESSEVITTDTIRLSNLPWDLLAEDLDVLLEVEAFRDALADPDFREVGLLLGLAAGELDLRSGGGRGGLGVGRLRFLSIQGDAESSQEERELVHGSGEGGLNIGKTALWTTKK